jgi:hypothetical protein
VYRKIRTKLPSIGAEEAMREAYRRAHVMAGRVSDYSPSAPLL